MTKFPNPHPFDMSNYYSGQTFILGGKDFNAPEKETVKVKASTDSKLPIKLDWSFLHRTEKNSAKRS